MGINERREREKTERRQSILNCARELILIHGVDRVSMEDIAQKAELSKATLYLYFPGKDVLFNEICEESARAFLEHFKSSLKSGLTGIAALKRFWRGYLEMYGSSDEMIFIFQVRTSLNSWLPITSPEEQSKSPYTDTIILMMKTIFDQCIAEGVFDPSLDSAMATRLSLSLFSVFIGNAAKMSPKIKKSAIMIKEMTNAFQILVYGFAKDDVDRSCLDIINM